jgi:putative hydrolase of the HAD superfamily
MEQETAYQKPTLRAVLFDFGGVLAEEGFSEGLKVIGRRWGLNPETFCQLGAKAAYESGYVSGKGNESDFWKQMCRESGIPRQDAAFTKEILRRFVLRPRMLAAVRSLRQRGYLTAILSDQTDWLDRLNARDHFFQEFDQVFNSYHLGKGKRDPSIFKESVEALGVKTREALFVDDNPEHVERARSCGLHVLLFNDQESFLSDLENTLGHPLDV